MNLEISLVLGILAFAIILFITNRIRIDLVGLLVLASLAICGLVTPSQALSGFSNPAVITVWAVLILSGGLARTGVASQLGKFVLRLAGESEIKLLAILMLTSGILSGFMNSIGVASLFLPVVIDISRRTNRPPSKLLMPLAFSSLLGGLTTLIGTPPNILISEALSNAGMIPFKMFAFTPIGFILLLSGVFFMILIGRHLLPHRDIAKELSGSSKSEITELYDIQDRVAYIQLPENSTLDGKSLIESRFGSALELNVVTVIRDNQTIMAPQPDFILRSSDRLLVEGQLDRLFDLHNKDQLVLDEEHLPIEKIVSTDVNLAELQISQGSSLQGLTLRQVAFRHAYRVIVLAIRRGEKSLYMDLETIQLNEGDILLVKGQQMDLDLLKYDSDFVLTMPVSTTEYQLEDHLMMVRIPSKSALIGNTLLSSRLGDAFGLSVLGIIRERSSELMPTPDEILQSGDTLLIKGSQKDLLTIRGLQNLEIETQTQPDLSELVSDETGLMEAVVSPHSTITGKAVRDLDFRDKYGLTILAIWREGRAYRSHLRDMKLRFGDALLLFGPHRRLQLFGAEPDFIVLTEDALPAPRTKKAPLAILIMVSVLLPVLFSLLPISIAAVAGVALMILTGCLSMDEAYRLIEWKAVFLIAGMLPLGLALDQTGAARLIGDNVVSLAGSAGPLAVSGALFFLAALGSQFMPNPAVAVLLAPIALSTASDLGVSPYPLMMIVAISSSAAFLSPVGHPANLLVMGPGGYRFSDYFKVGLPLTLLIMVVSLIVLPIFWPF